MCVVFIGIMYTYIYGYVYIIILVEPLQDCLFAPEAAWKNPDPHRYIYWYLFIYTHKCIIWSMNDFEMSIYIYIHSIYTFNCFHNKRYVLLYIYTNRYTHIYTHPSNHFSSRTYVLRFKTFIYIYIYIYTYTFLKRNYMYIYICTNSFYM